VIAKLGRALQLVLALTGALVVNLGLVCALVKLNTQKVDAAPGQQSLGILMQVELSPPPEPTPEPPEPAPEPLPELATVELDLAPPQVAPPEPMPTSFDVAVPGLSSIRIAVPAPAALRSRPKTRRVQGHAPRQPRAADSVDQPPRELPGNTAPHFPRRARRRGITGQVIVRLLIDERGQVQRALVAQSTGHPSFGKAVLEVARSWRFSPPIHRGQAVKVWGRKLVRFVTPE